MRKGIKNKTIYWLAYAFYPLFHCYHIRRPLHHFLQTFKTDGIPLHVCNINADLKDLWINKKNKDNIHFLVLVCRHVYSAVPARKPKITVQIDEAGYFNVQPRSSGGSSNAVLSSDREMRNHDPRIYGIWFGIWSPSKQWLSRRSKGTFIPLEALSVVFWDWLTLTGLHHK